MGAGAGVCAAAGAVCATAGAAAVGVGGAAAGVGACALVAGAPVPPAATAGRGGGGGRFGVAGVWNPVAAVFVPVAAVFFLVAIFCLFLYKTRLAAALVFIQLWALLQKTQLSTNYYITYTVYVKQLMAIYNMAIYGYIWLYMEFREGLSNMSKSVTLLGVRCS